MHTPTIIELPSRDETEAARAKFWRKNVARMTRKELAKATGYSVSAIGLFEQGYDNIGRPLGERALETLPPGVRRDHGARSQAARLDERKGERRMKKDKVAKVMGEYKRGELHSGSKSGPKVKSRKQAIAIGLSEARKKRLSKASV